MDQQNFALQSMQDTIETVNTMKQTAKVMKKQFKKIKIPKIEKIQDKIEDLMLDNDDVQDVLSRGYENVSEVDSDELDDIMGSMDEFDLEENLEDEKEPEYLQDGAMPENFLKDAPTGEIGQEEGVPQKPKAVGTTPGI